MLSRRFYLLYKTEKGRETKKDKEIRRETRRDVFWLVLFMATICMRSFINKFIVLQRVGLEEPLQSYILDTLYIYICNLCCILKGAFGKSESLKIISLITIMLII